MGSRRFEFVLSYCCAVVLSYISTVVLKKSSAFMKVCGKIKADIRFNALFLFCGNTGLYNRLSTNGKIENYISLVAERIK